VSQAIAASVLISITGEVQVKPGQRLICDHSNQLSRKILATAMRVWRNSESFTMTIIHWITTLERQDIKQQFVAQTDRRKSTATGRQWRATIKRQNTALIVPKNNGLQTTICFHISQQMPPEDNIYRKQRAALNMNILYIQCASNTSLVSAVTPVNDIWTSVWIQSNHIFLYTSPMSYGLGHLIIRWILKKKEQSIDNICMTVIEWFHFLQIHMIFSNLSALSSLPVMRLLTNMFAFAYEVFHSEFRKLYTLSHIIRYPSLYWCPDVKDFNSPTQGRCRIYKQYHHAQYNKTIKKRLAVDNGLATNGSEIE